MRLDKFLKVACLVKRRTIAALLCDQGKVTVGDRPAKASREVAVGDQIAVTFPRRTVVVEVLAVPDGNVRKDELERYYRLIQVTDHPDPL